MKCKGVQDSFCNITQPLGKLQIESCIHKIHYLCFKERERDGEIFKELKSIVRGLATGSSNARKGLFAAFVGLIRIFASTVCFRTCFHVIEKELLSCINN